MSCVISWWSPDLVSVAFVTMKSNLGQWLFTLDDAFFPAVHGGKRFLDCVWMRLLSMGPRVCIPERTILRQLWMGGSPDRFMRSYGIFMIKLPYVDFMTLEIILLVLTDYNIQFHGIIMRNFVFHHLIILVILLRKMDLLDFHGNSQIITRFCKMFIIMKLAFPSPH